MPVVGDVNALPYYADVEGAEEFSFTVTEPGAGNPAVISVPGDFVFQFLTIGCDLLTDATVANRIMRIDVFDGSTDLTFVPSILTVPASVELGHLWSREIHTAYSVGGTFGVNPIFPNVVLPSQQVRLLAQNGSAGDRIRFISATVIRYPTSVAGRASAVTSAIPTPLLT